MKQIKLMLLLLGIGYAAPVSATAQGMLDLPPFYESFLAYPRCVAIDTAIMLPCGQFGEFLVTEMPIPSLQVCCSAITVATGQTLSVQGGIEYTACGATYSLELNWSQTQEFSTTFDGAAPCGCVQVMVQKDWRVQQFIREYTRCFQNGQEEQWQEKRRVVDELPNSTRLVPHYFTRVPSPCGNCTPQGRPINPNESPANGWDSSLPHGFPTVLPAARPRPAGVPWDESIHGPLRSSTEAFPDGRFKQLTIDMSEWGSAREIDSPLSLTVYEVAEIYRSINESRQSPFDCGDQSRVRVILSPGVEIVGTLRRLSNSLLGYSSSLFNSRFYGDFNDDGSRDQSDLDMLLPHVNQNESPADSRRFDVNGDGAVDEVDVHVWIELVLG